MPGDPDALAQVHVVGGNPGDLGRAVAGLLQGEHEIAERLVHDRGEDRLALLEG
jgi:hypothetical protein